jgi:hypothetical protein
MAVVMSIYDSIPKSRRYCSSSTKRCLALNADRNKTSRRDSWLILNSCALKFLTWRMYNHSCANKNGIHSVEYPLVSAAKFVFNYWIFLESWDYLFVMASVSVEMRSSNKMRLDGPFFDTIQYIKSINSSLY